MKLTHLANQRVVVSRLLPVGGSSTRLALSTVTAAFGHLQPIAPDKALLVGGIPGKLYRIFCEGDLDIVEGDQLKDEAGAVYTVRKGGVTRWQHGAQDFKEVYIQQT